MKSGEGWGESVATIDTNYEMALRDEQDIRYLPLTEIRMEVEKR